MRIPRSIHRVWLGGEIPAEFVRYEEQWRELHPGWTVKTWREDELGWMRNGSVFEDAPLFSSKSNIARYEIILREGGFYVDTDYEPLRSFDELLRDADLVVAEEEPAFYANALFGAPAGSPVMQRLVDDLANSHYSRDGEISPQRTGPNFFTRTVRRALAEHPELDVQVLSREQVIPYSWKQEHLRHADLRHAFAAHHWARSWVAPSNDSTWADGAREVTKRAVCTSKRVIAKARQRWDQIEPRTRRPAPTPVVELGDQRLMLVSSTGIPMIASTVDTELIAAITIEGEHDPAFMAFLRRELRDGDVVAIAGSSIGAAVLQSAWVVRRMGRVFAFDDDETRTELLAESVVLNRKRGLESDVVVSAGGAGNECLADALKGNPEIGFVRLDAGDDQADVLASLRDLVDRGAVRLLDVALCDRALGATFGPLAEQLRAITERWRPNTFAIGPHGERVPLSTEAAINSDEVAHLVLEFDVQPQ